MRVFYLHGFASSARSSKAAFFAARLREHGIDLRTPDFNEPDFTTLTITRMIDQVSGGIDDAGGGPAALIGSSLGAFVAVQAAVARPDAVTRLVLLAPAIEFTGERLRELGDVDAWERTNRLDVFHYGFGRVLPVHFGLYTDACRYDCVTADVRIPVQVFQGRRDTAVDPAAVERWAAARPHVELHLLDDDHQLLSSLEYIWTHARRFLQLPPA